MSVASERWVRAAKALAGLLAVAAIFALVWFLTLGRHDELATLSGHKDGTFALVLSPDGTEVASGGGDGEIRIWDVASKQTKNVLKGHEGKVLALAWSADGGTLASGGEDCSVRLWDPTTGQKKQIHSKLPRPVQALAISSDGKFLASAVENVVYTWGTDLSLPPNKLRGHRLYVSGLTFLPGRHELVSFGTDKAVRFWDLDTGKQLPTLPAPTGHCHGLALSADGKLLACIGGGRAQLYDLENRKPLEAIEPHARTLCGIAFSPDHKLLALGSEDKVIVIWDLAAKKELARLRGHAFAVGPMAFLPDGRTLVSAGYDSTLKFWKVQ
jgi:WD40 repeat protein